MGKKKTDKRSLTGKAERTPILPLRVPPAERKRWEDARKLTKFANLSAWIRATLTKEARRLLNRARK